MPNLHIDVYEHAGFSTVSQMRRAIARAVSRLKGENHVKYYFHVLFPDKFSIDVPLNFPVFSKTPVTVSDMRRHLAALLSSLRGTDRETDPVTFTFHCRVELPAAEKVAA